MPDCASRIWDVDAAADYAVGLLLWLDRSVSERDLHKNGKKWRRDVSISPPYHALSLMKVGLLGLDAVAEVLSAVCARLAVRSLSARRGRRTRSALLAARA